MWESQFYCTTKKYLHTVTQWSGDNKLLKVASSCWTILLKRPWFMVVMSSIDLTLVWAVVGCSALVTLHSCELHGRLTQLSMIIEKAMSLVAVTVPTAPQSCVYTDFSTPWSCQFQGGTVSYGMPGVGGSGNGTVPHGSTWYRNWNICHHTSYVVSRYDNVFEEFPTHRWNHNH